MLGDFEYYNPTKLFFGEHALDFLHDELQHYGPKVMLTYGGGSIKRNGIYDAVCTILHQCNKQIVELSGVMPNPTKDKLYEGAALARQEAVDLILAVGGGSTIDYAKGVAASAYCTTDPWTTYWLNGGEPTCKVIPVGCVLTLAGTGSEMNSGSVITDHATNCKRGKTFGADLIPRFAILNPRYTFTLPKYQMVAGIYDIFNHICEQYFSDFDDNTTDYIAEGLMRSTIKSARDAVANPENYEARSNIMWTATWALNTLLKKGKTTDWMVHMIGHAVGGFTNATHGHTLSAVSLAYYRTQLHDGLPKFVRWAKTVWEVDAEGKDDLQVANEGLSRMEAWMRELGLTMNISELGVKPDMIDDIASSVVLLKGGYHPLTKNEVAEVLRASL